MKNILFVTDSFSQGGLETRILEQTAFLKKHHLHSFLLCHHFDNTCPNSFDAISDSLLSYSGNNCLYSHEILADVKTICNFCKKHHIDFIDCHPFWCSLPVAIAAKLLKIPTSFTLHGLTSGDFIADEFLTIKTLYYIALDYGFDQLFAVGEHLTNLYSYLSDVIILPNGVNLEKYQPKKFKKSQKIAIASRLDQTKAQIVLDFLPLIYKYKYINEIDIFGNGDYSEKILAFVHDHNLDDKVKIHGWVDNLTEELHHNDYLAVFGMGRVIVDALNSNTPAGVLGYQGFAGLINHKNLPTFVKTNLTSWDNQDSSLFKELDLLVKDPAPYLFKKSELSILDASLIWQNYLNIINQIHFTPNPALSNIYQLLSENPDVDLMCNEKIFSECVHILADGKKPVSERLFYSIFKMQSKQIEHLKNSQTKPNLLRRAIKKITK